MPFAQAEDAPAVGDDDDAHLAPPVGERLRDAAAMLERQVEAARADEDPAPLQAGVADRRGIDEGQQLLQVVDEHAEKERLVLVLHLAQVEVFLERARAGADAGEHPCGLLGERLDAGRQEPIEPEPAALLGSEGRALVRHGPSCIGTPPRI
jgi:hypothetical protein